MYVVYEIKPVFNECLANVKTFFQWLKHILQFSLMRLKIFDCF